MQAALIPVAYTAGTDFRARRPPSLGHDDPLGAAVGRLGASPQIEVRTKLFEHKAL
jgi:hypothetical protein